MRVWPWLANPQGRRAVDGDLQIVFVGPGQALGAGQFSLGMAFAVFQQPLLDLAFRRFGVLHGGNGLVLDAQLFAAP